MRIIQELFGYFFIGLIGMVGLAILFLPLHFILRKRMPLSRQIAYFLFASFVLIILEATVLSTFVHNLMSGRGIIVMERTLNIIPFQVITKPWQMDEQKKIAQTIANILMFVPLGFVFPMVWKKGRKFWIVAMNMALFSFGIEFIQYFIGRSSDIDDVILNTLGGILGYLVCTLFEKLFKDKLSWKRIDGLPSVGKS